MCSHLVLWLLQPVLQLPVFSSLDFVTFASCPDSLGPPQSVYAVTLLPFGQPHSPDGPTPHP